MKNIIDAIGIVETLHSKCRQIHTRDPTFYALIGYQVYLSP